MSDKAALRRLCEDCLAGHFQNALSRIQGMVLDTPSSIKSVVAVCNACHQTPEKIVPEDLCKLLLVLVKTIKTPRNEDFDRYLQSLPFIISVLITKKRFELIVTLQALLTAPTVPIHTDQHRNLYRKTYIIIYNQVVEIVKSRSEKHANVVPDLCNLLIDIYLQKLDLKTDYFQAVHNLLTALTTLKIQPEIIERFYAKSLSTGTSDEFCSIINNFKCVFYSFLRAESFQSAAISYEKTAKYLAKFYTKSEQVLLGKMLDIVDWLNPIKITDKVPEKVHSYLKSYHRTYKSTKSLETVCELISTVALTSASWCKKNKVTNLDSQLSFYQLLNDVAHILSKSVHQCPCKCSTATNVLESVKIFNAIGLFGRSHIVTLPTNQQFSNQLLGYLDKMLNQVQLLKANKCQKWANQWYDLAVHLYSIGLHFHRNNADLVILYLDRFVKALMDLEGPHPQIIEKQCLTSALNMCADSYLTNKDYLRALLLTAVSVILSPNEGTRWVKTKSAMRNDSIESNQLETMTFVRIFDTYKHLLSFHLEDLTVEHKIALLIYELRQYSSLWKSKRLMSVTYGELCQLATPQQCAEVFCEVWEFGELAIDNGLIQHLKATIRRLDQEKNPNLFTLAHLHFLLYKYHVKDMMHRQCNDMEKTLNVPKKSDALVPPDPNDECDLFSSYECLTLTNYTKMMQNLNKSLDLVQKYPSDDSKAYRLLANIAHEFRLQGQGNRSLEAWKLALETTNNCGERLEAFGFILELSDVSQLAALPELDLDLVSFNQLIVFYLCKAEAYFNVDFKAAYAAFCEALRLHEKHESSRVEKARLHLLYHKFVSLPCQYQVQGHKEYSLVKIFQAAQCINEHFDSTNCTSYDMRVFFDVYEVMVKMYHDLRFPREVRCYARDAVKMAQQMVLPFKTCTFLSYLIVADLRSCRFDDCRVKIKDLADILELGVVATKPKQFKEVLDEVVDDFSEMVLDVPSERKMGSPFLMTDNFQLPEFLTHEKCQCFRCNSLEYQRFVLQKTFLHSLLYEYEGNIKLAKNFFFGCMKIYEALKTRFVQAEKLLDIYAEILYAYAAFSLRMDKFQQAEKFNQKALSKLKNIRVQFVHLYNEVLLQRIDIVATKCYKDDRPMQRLDVEKSEFLLKTPPSKQSLVKVSPIAKEEFEKFRPKVIAFDLTESDDEELVKPEKNSTKIKIYTSKTEVKVRKARVVSERVPVTPSVAPVGNDLLASRTKLLTEKLRSSSRRLPESVSERKGVRQNLMRQLEEDVENGGFKAPEKVGSSGRKCSNDEKKSVRLNLMNQLEEAEGGPPVRRSARNKK